VYVPLQNPTQLVLHYVIVGVLSVVVGLVFAGILAFVLYKILGRARVAARARIVGWVTVALVVLVPVWLWMTRSSYVGVRVDGRQIELVYAEWPRAPKRFDVDRIESVSLTWTGRRTKSPQLVIIVKPTGVFENTRWESTSGDEAYITRAMEWIEHAAGGRLQRARPPVPR
jgi:hypothetical protein